MLRTLNAVWNWNGTGGVFGKIFAALGEQKNLRTRTVPVKFQENLRSTWRAEKPWDSNGTGGVFGKIFAALGEQKNLRTGTVPVKFQENLRSTWRAEKLWNWNGTGGVLGKIFAALGEQKNLRTRTVPVEFSGKSSQHLASRKTLELHRYRSSFQNKLDPLGTQKNR